MSTETKTDVMILGSGLAGGCLARQLSLQFPDLDITVIDKRETFDFWVGESTVEVWTDYALRVLGLGPYLMKNHLVKQALRFYWDNEDKSLPIPEMSEYGVTGYHKLMSMQIDRSTFDRDLAALNRQNGVHVELGVRVLRRGENGGEPGLNIDRDGGHTVVTNRGTYRCRYLVDATGRGSPLGQHLGISGPDKRHPIGAYWGRVKNCRNIDELGDEQWGRRTAFAMRYLATNHFMYKGYWIWLIPIDQDLMSIGVAYDNEVAPLRVKDKDEFMGFLREHRCMRDLLPAEAEIVDFLGFRHIARTAEQLYSTDRWFLTGMAGVFTDPYLSFGCILIAMSNRLVGQIIQADLEGDPQRVQRRVDYFNAFMKSMYDGVRTSNNHRRFGSYDALMPFRRARQLWYHNRLIPLGMEDLKSVVEAADRGETFATDQLHLVARARRYVDEYIELLEAHGLYYARNKGEYFDGKPRTAIQQKYWLHRDPAAEDREDAITFRDMYRRYVTRTCEILEIPFSEATFEELLRMCKDKHITLQQSAEVMRERHRVSA